MLNIFLGTIAGVPTSSHFHILESKFSIYLQFF